MIDSILTERGQVSVPSTLRKKMKLRPGARLRWEQVSGSEFRVTVAPKEQPAKKPAGVMAMLGYARVLFPDRPPRTTAEVMREIRGSWKD
jgi:bifunctional DNA-binding transcriptional regulator/antitoxin component of YhaV-PrlF toxin-antitoxin module